AGTLGRASLLVVSLACATGLSFLCCRATRCELARTAWRGETPTAPPGRRSRAAGGVSPARPGNGFWRCHPSLRAITTGAVRESAGLTRPRAGWSCPLATVDLFARG